MMPVKTAKVHVLPKVCSLHQRENTSNLFDLYHVYINLQNKKDKLTSVKPILRVTVLIERFLKTYSIWMFYCKGELN